MNPLCLFQDCFVNSYKINVIYVPCGVIYNNILYNSIFNVDVSEALLSVSTFLSSHSTDTVDLIVEQSESYCVLHSIIITDAVQ